MVFVREKKNINSNENQKLLLDRELVENEMRRYMRSYDILYIPSHQIHYSLPFSFL